MDLGHSTATVDRLRDEIQSVQYREATATFCHLVAVEKRPLKAMIKEAIAAAAPYVQVPSHMMRLPSGEMQKISAAEVATMTQRWSSDQSIARS